MSAMPARLGAVVVFGLLLGLCFGLACGSTTRAIGKAALADVVDCTAPDRAKLEAQFGPTVEQAILRATGGDGKVDLPSLQQIGSALESDGWCVLEHAVAQLIAAATKSPGTASAAASLDAQDLAAQLARLRVAKFGATRFELGAAP